MSSFFALNDIRNNILETDIRNNFSITVPIFYTVFYDLFSQMSSIAKLNKLQFCMDPFSARVLPMFPRVI